MTNSRTGAARDKERSPRAHQIDAAGPAAAPAVHAPSTLGVQRAVTDPAAAEPAEIIALQKSHGNRAVSGLLAGRVQPKLMVGPADDAYEREADRFADQIISGPAPVVNRQPANPEDDELAQRVAMPEDDELAQAKPLADGITPVVQRASPEDGFETHPDVEDRLRAHQGGGQPLPDGTRSFMEQRFGADFSPVRVHTGSEAVQLNRELHAQAFTHGPNIYFSAGKYNPANTSGQRLLAHELTHVLQQTGAKSVRTVRRASARTLARASSPVIQRATWGDRWRAIKGKFTWKNIKDALLKTVGGPIYQFYKVYKAKKAGEDVDAFSVKDFKKYAAMLRGDSSSEYGAYIGKVPVLTKMLDLFVGEVAGVVNWLTFWFGLLGLLPFCQALLPLAGTFFGISVFASLARVGLNSILDAWSSFLSLYRYRQIEKLADKRTGALPDAAQAKVRAYMVGLGEYQGNRAGYMTNLIGAAIGFATTTGANLAGGMTAVDSMRGAIDPTAQISSIVGTKANLDMAAKTYTGSMGQQTGYGAEGVLGPLGLGRQTASVNVGASVGVTPIGEGLSGTFGEHERKGQGPKARPGHIPNSAEAANYQAGDFTNLRQLPKPQLTTVSGKLRGLLNPITAIYQIITGGIAIVRGVISAVAAAVGLIKKLLQFLANPVESARKAKAYFTERDQQGDTGFGRWRKRTGEKMRKWWNRNLSESRTGERDYTMARAKFEPGVQRVDESETEDEETTAGPQTNDGAERSEVELDPRTRTGLEKLTQGNKAQTVAGKLTDIQSVLGEARDQVSGAADETRTIESEGV